MTNNIEQFCSTNQGYLPMLYIRDGVEYATDGVTVAWLNTDAPDNVTHWTPTLTPSKAVADRQAAAGKFQPFTMPRYEPVVVVCPDCKGSGVIPEFTDCDECSGGGTVECDLGHRHDCLVCGGVGEFENDNHGPCAACGETGKVNDPNQTLSLCGVTLGAARLAKLAAWLPEETVCAGACDCVVFRFAGGGALLMRMER